MVHLRIFSFINIFFFVIFFNFLIGPTVLAADRSISLRPNYTGVFTKDIYTQDSIITNAAPRLQTGVMSETQLDENLTEELFRLKKVKLREAVFVKIRRKTSAWEGEKVIAEKRAFWSSILDVINPVGVGLMSCRDAWMGCKDSQGLVAVAVAMLVKGAGNIALNKYYASHEVIKIQTDLTLLQKEEEDLYRGLNQELISDLEVSYVKRKRFIKNNKLEKEIEDALLEARYPDVVMPFVRQFIQNALLLPIKPKVLLNPQSTDFSWEELQKRFQENPFFQGFEEATRSQLETLIRQIAYASVDSNDSAVPLRKCCYFWGNPGVGKSKAATEIAKFLGLPFFEASIREASELSRSNLEGMDRSRQDPNIGWMVTPLITPSGDGETYQNGILILNDFDRVLYSTAMGGTALALLLDYLDPIKRDIPHHPYFRSGVNISRMSIIITANRPIPPAGDHNGLYEALRTRVKGNEIEFPDFDEHHKSKILNDYLLSVRKRYNLPNSYTFKYVAPQQVEVAYDPALIGTYGINLAEMQDLPKLLPLTLLPQQVNLRDLEAVVNATLDTFKNLLLEERRSSYEQAIAMGVPSVHLHRKAALAGHPDSALHLGKTTIGDISTQWYRLAAENGSHEATYHLGQQADLSLDNRLRWADLAFKRENKGSYAYLLSQLYSESLNLEAANVWLEKAVNLNYTPARSMLAEQYMLVKSKRDLSKGILINLAENGDAVSIPLLYKLGETYEEDAQIEKALECYKTAYNYGNHGRSSFKIGWIFFQRREFTSSLEWLNKGDNLGDIHATNLLAVLHSDALSVAKDLKKAETLWNKVLGMSLFVPLNLHVHFCTAVNDAQVDPFLKILQGFTSYCAQNKASATGISFRNYFKTQQIIPDVYFGMDGDISCGIGYMHLRGLKLSQNCSSARNWFQISSDLGNKTGRDAFQLVNQPIQALFFYIWGAYDVFSSH